MALTIETAQIEPDITVLLLTGAITLGEDCESFEKRVSGLLRQGHKKLVVDLSSVNYIDSAGLGVLTLCSGSATQAGGALALAGASGIARRLFELTRVDTILPIYPTVEAAAHALAS